MKQIMEVAGTSEQLEQIQGFIALINRDEYEKNRVQAKVLDIEDIMMSLRGRILGDRQVQAVLEAR